ncbi:MAG: peptide ABC transporter substrate-binding protein [Bacillota bacterium]|nr:peptide ABC transporter substrate-binding protein [Bacillota bacterium]
MKSKKIKALAISMAVLVTGATFVGCGNKTGTSAVKQVVTYNLGADPKTIDPGLNDSLEGSNVISNAFEGLLRLDENSQPVAGVAEKWEISQDGLTYTFHLRKDAKWSDGKPVKAGDFEYAWKRALAPETASSYAYQLYYLKNAQGYNESTLPADKKTPGVAPATANDVGVKAVDDYTLQVTLVSPTQYFLSLTTSPTYAPLRKDIVDKDPKGWATKASTYITDGPFKMKEWKAKDTMVFVKDPNYWNAKNIKLDQLNYKMLDQESSYMSAFTTGQIDVIDSPPAQQIPQLLKNGTAKSYPNLGTYYYCINISPEAEKLDPAAAKVLKDPRVRKAINLAIDRNQIINNVTKAGQKPATSFVPSGIIMSDGKDFKTKDYFKAEGDVTEAKRLLAEAGYPDGKGFPAIELIYNTMQTHQDIAQAIQDMLRKNLGIQLNLRNVERKVHVTDANTHQFIMIREGWSADYADPMTFLDMWVTGGGNNFAGYSNPEYDKLIAQAKAETNAQKRSDDMHAAEDILMNDMPIIPIYEYNFITCIKPSVKGVYRSPLGFIFFDKAYVQK